MSDFIEFKVASYDVASNKPKLEAGLKYLKEALKDIEALATSEKCQQITDYIYTLVTMTFYHQSDDPLRIFMENDYQYIWTNLVDYYAKSCDTLKKNNVGKVKILNDILKILNYLCAYSLKFRLFFYQNNGLKSLVIFLNSKAFCENFNDLNGFEALIMNINWLSKNAELYKAEWNELNVGQSLLRIATTYPKCKLHAYMAFVNIANDKQIETLSETHLIISILTGFLNDIANVFNSGVSLSREKQQFIEDDDNAPIDHEVYFLTVEKYNVKYSVTGILLALYRLSVNHKIKYTMYCEDNLKDPLRVFIFKGNDIEKKYALQVLAQLCFDQRVSDLVCKDTELKDHIQSLAKKTDTIVKQLPKLCKQISWVFELQHDQKVQQQQVQQQQQKNKVMISYNSASRELCLKIKDELEHAGYKVWIDVSEIHGSSLEAMARAVESSDWILICVTEKYRQSINCQAEAQYAFKLKKPIIPLIMQKGYEDIDGWLGIIMGDKIFINYLKYQFQECMTRLLNELTKSQAALSNAPLPLQIVNAQQTRSRPQQQMHDTSDVLNWDESKVNAWFKEKNIDTSILAILQPCDGELLHQLYSLQRDAPEFFYQSIAKNNATSLRNVLLFTLNLKKLFHN